MKKVLFVVLAICLMAVPAFAGSDVKAYGDTESLYGQGMGQTLSNEWGYAHIVKGTVEVDVRGIGAVNTVAAGSGLGVMDAEISASRTTTTADSVYGVSSDRVQMTGSSDLSSVAGVGADSSGFSAAAGGTVHTNTNYGQGQAGLMYGPGYAGVGVSHGAGSVTINVGAGSAF